MPIRPQKLYSGHMFPGSFNFIFSQTSLNIKKLNEQGIMLLVVAMHFDSRFDPLAGQDDERFFCPSESTFVQLVCAPDPPSCTRHTPKCVHTLKILYPFVAKEEAAHSQPVIY